MAIETLDDIIEEAADRLGVWGAHFEDDTSPWKEPKQNCDCRVCFVTGLRERILDAVEIEQALAEYRNTGKNRESCPEQRKESTQNE